MKEIVEVNGVKFEVDLSTAKKVQEFKVGDTVKVLIKEYQGYKSCLGTIIGFDWFERRPNIRIAYLNVDYSSAQIKTLDYFAGNEDVEISPLGYLGELEFTQTNIIEIMNREIENKELELKKAIRNKKIFLSTFGKYFEPKEQK